MTYKIASCNTIYECWRDLEFGEIGLVASSSQWQDNFETEAYKGKVNAIKIENSEYISFDPLHFSKFAKCDLCTCLYLMTWKNISINLVKKKGSLNGSTQIYNLNRIYTLFLIN